MACPIMAPSNTWYKTSVLRSTITEINIVDSYIPTGNETESWNADVDNSGSIKCYLNGTVLTIAGNGSGKIALNEDSSYLFSSVAVDASSAKNMFISCSAINDLTIFDSSAVKNLRQAFGYCISVTELDLTGWDVSNVENMRFTFGANQVIGVMSLITVKGIENWDTGNVTTMQALFQYCGSLAEANVANWDVSKVTSMYGTFCYCSSLKTVSAGNWDTSSCMDMSKMFQGCSALTTVSASGWDTSACTNMQYMFNKCTSLIQLDVSKWDVSKVTNFKSMFGMNDYGTNPPPIKNIDVANWDTSSCTDMSYMFYGLGSVDLLDVSNWDVSKVITFDHMFAHSYLTLTSVSNWTTPAATNMNAMFYSVNNSELDVSNLVTKNVTCFDQMFENCQRLTKIIGLEKFDTSNSYGFSEMFNNCYKLTTLDLSSFDTRKAKDGAIASSNGSYTTTMSNMFGNMRCLEKITVGEYFSFNGDGTTISNAAVLPTPSSEYIPNTDGYWHTIEGAVYAPIDIPNMTANTYYCADPVWLRDYLVKGETLSAIADAIRAGNGSTEKYLPTDYAKAIGNIAEDSFEAGKKAEYDAFWDEYQNYGNYEDTKFSSERLFAFSRWTDKNFFPKYDIKIGPGGNGTAYFLFASSQITNLTQRLKDCKVVLDTSNAKTGNEMFAWCPLLTHIPTVSLVGMKDSNATYIFAGCPNLIEIEQIILPSEGFSGGIKYWFTGAKSLTTLKIQGTILQEGFDLSPAIILSKPSIISVINALSTSTSGLTITLSLTAVNNAFETTEGAADGSTSEEWLALAATKSNWTISLV